jgi:hypothetical protein
MKELQNLGRNLTKLEQKKIFGGLVDPNEGADTCCQATSDCPDKTGWHKACSTSICCGADMTKYKCFWTQIG